MFITRRADYAIRCVLYLAKNSGNVVKINEIAESMHVPKSFLAKILQQLAYCGIVNSSRGLAGGFRLARAPEDINMLDVIESIQGVSASSQCAVDKKSCNLSDKCSVHPVWIKLREMVENELKNQNFRKLAGKKINKGFTAKKIKIKY
jgi:Rrf2 family protein